MKIKIKWLAGAATVALGLFSLSRFGTEPSRLGRISPLFNIKSITFHPLTASEALQTDAEVSVVPKYNIAQLLDVAHKDRTTIPFRAKHTSFYFAHRESIVHMDPYAAVRKDRYVGNVSLVPNLYPYFGSFHGHTQNSDGKGTPDEAFQLGKKVARLDFMGITDHSEPMYGESGLKTWKSSEASAEKVSDDNFIAMNGFEYSHIALGHYVVFGSDTLRTSIFDTSISSFYDWLYSLPPDDLVVFFAHPGYHTYRQSLEFDHFRYDPRLKDIIVATEVIHRNDYQKFLHGFGGEIPYIDEALLQGWRVGSIASQDSHVSTWGIQDSVRTVLLMPSLSKENIISALRNHRMYATNNESLEFSFNFPDKEQNQFHVMGERLDPSDVPTEGEMIIRYFDPKGFQPPERLEIVCQGNVVGTYEFEAINENTDPRLFSEYDTVVAQQLTQNLSSRYYNDLNFTPSGGEFRVNYKLPPNLNQDTYVYVRFYQGFDGEYFTQSSPIFISSKK